MKLPQPEPGALDPAIWTSEERTSVLRTHAAQNSAASIEETIALLEAAEIGPGHRVLDIACGPGDPTLEIASRVTPGGDVTGIDLSEGALSVARERAESARLTNVTFLSANAEELPFPEATFDRAVSRFGFMFFQDLPRALREVHRVLRPGGRLAVMVWGPFDQPYFQLTVGVLLRTQGVSELPRDRAVQFRFAPPGSLEAALTTARFENVEGRIRNLRWMRKGTPEEVRDAWAAGAVYQRPLIDALSDESRSRAWKEIAEGFRRFYDGEWVRVPLVVRVVTASR